mgnify:CR=1 FL=1
MEVEAESFNVLVKEMRSLGMNVELKSLSDGEEDDENNLLELVLRGGFRRKRLEPRTGVLPRKDLL